MATDPTTLDPIWQDPQRSRDKLKNNAGEADTYRVLAALIDEAVKLPREMEKAY